MSNRTGKREREAGRRHKRGLTYGWDGLTGTGSLRLKLGRKKAHSFCSSQRMEHFNLKCFGMAALPVAEAERQETKVQRRVTAGQPVSSPARDAVSTEER